jgi:hypothetical protein
MTLKDTVKTLLKKGLIIKLVFTDKEIKRFCTVMNGKWINILNIQLPVDNDKVYDVYTGDVVDVDKIDIDIIEYVSAPSNILLQDLITPSAAVESLGDDFLKQHEEYITSARKHLLGLKLAFKQAIDEFMQPFGELPEQDLKDRYFLIFYPQRLNTNGETRKMVEQHIKERYFIYNGTYTAPAVKGVSTIHALALLGICDENLSITDSEYIDALKRQWFKLIDNEKQAVLSKLNTLREFANDDEHDLLEEIDEYEAILDSIDIDMLNNLDTVKDVISFWPEALQPRPYFIYED